MGFDSEMMQGEVLGSIVMSYTLLTFSLLAGLAVLVVAAQPSGSRAAIGGVWLLAIPTAFLMFLAIQAPSDSFPASICFHGLSFFRAYGGPRTITMPDFREAASAAAAGIVGSGILGGPIFAYVAFSNPQGVRAIIEWFGGSVGWLFQTARSPRQTVRVLRTALLAAVVVIGLGVAAYAVVPWGASARLLALQFRPPWLQTGEVTWFEGQREVSVRLDNVWRRINLPRCARQYWVLRETPQGWAEIQTESLLGKERSRRGAHDSRPFFHKPVQPKWIRGDGWVRIKVECPK